MGTQQDCMGASSNAHNLQLAALIMRHAYMAETIRATCCYPLLPAATRCYQLQPLDPAWRIAHSRTERTTRAYNLLLAPFIMRHGHFRAETIRTTRCYPLLPTATCCSRWAQLCIAHSRTAWAYHQMHTACNWHPSSCAMHTLGLRQSGLARCYPLLPAAAAGPSLAHCSQQDCMGAPSNAHNQQLAALIMRHASMAETIRDTRCYPLLPTANCCCNPLLQA